MSPNRLPSLGLALNPSFLQNTRALEYASNSAIGLQLYDSEDDLLPHLVSAASQPSFLLSEAACHVEPEGNEDPNTENRDGTFTDAEDIFDRTNGFATIFKKVTAAVKRVFTAVFKA